MVTMEMMVTHSVHLGMAKSMVQPLQLEML